MISNDRVKKIILEALIMDIAVDCSDIIMMVMRIACFICCIIQRNVLFAKIQYSLYRTRGKHL